MGIINNGKDNFFMHGFMCGLALFPVIFITGSWVGFIVRSFVLALLMGGWSRLIGNDTAEEFGRGFVLPITIFLV